MTNSHRPVESEAGLQPKEYALGHHGSQVGRGGKIPFAAALFALQCVHVYAARTYARLPVVG